MLELPARYDSKESNVSIGLLSEDEIYNFWESKGLFHGSVAPGKPKFVIAIPPPNITGILTMGHVLDNTPQDIMVRFARMKGLVTAWIPGTDHAGIATQNVVEKDLAKQGMSKQQLGREAFVEKCWEWRGMYGNRIIEQLKKLGCSCDWQRTRFTMDSELSYAVREAFVRLCEEGLVYQGEYLVNWCPRCLTALSDEEVEYREITGGLYWIKYPVKDSSESITVATTRPETMLGDTAVAVHPDDERYKNLINKTIVLPLTNREIPIIADARVDIKFGSGAVKITPAHDPNDFAMGKDHKLQSISILTKDAKMNENAGPYQGLDRFKCREKVIADLTALGLLLKQEKYKHSVGHCYRCNTAIEPSISTQWFINMKPLAEPAIEAVKSGKIVFVPDRWTKIYLDWMENIRDWCISRQLWWGHRIPVWYCRKCGQKTITRKDPTQCRHCQSTDIYQDPDVLDTWFSSWLWPFSTLGWPEETPEYEYFYPTTVLNAGKDIIFFWVARMIMAGFQFTGKAPFKVVYFHGIARDNQGRKMSKSLGNSPDPIEVFEKYGADAVRLGIMSNVPLGEDVKISDKIYELGRNFITKLWNSSRFFLSNAGDFSRITAPMQEDKLDFEDRWILSRLNSTIRVYTETLEIFQFGEAAHIIYDYFWHDLCDWYIEIVKPRLRGERGEESKLIALHVLYQCLQDTVKMLHPYTPFVTEKLWQVFRRLEGEGTGMEESIASARWPACNARRISISIEQEMDVLMQGISGIRDVRARMNIPKNKPLSALISADNEEVLAKIREHQTLLKEIAVLDAIEYGLNLAKPPKSASCLVAGYKIFVPLGDVIDIEKESAKLRTQLKKTQEQLAGVEKKLSNPDFAEHAPEEIVEMEKQRKEETAAQIAAIEESLKDFAQ
ncbi:MAG: valine--tRNA ligase [Planctomycetes bacterium]|nr:valine--tRNA ligase [Planctomycetota bacterium]